MKSLTLKSKLLFGSILIGLIPAMTLQINSYLSSKKMASFVNTQAFSTADNISSTIDRNMYERYGDVQAFGLNSVVEKKEAWYKPGPDNPIINAMNKYSVGYGMYYLSLFVDLDGQVIAVNTVDKDNKNIDTSFLYKENFATQRWFKDSIKGNFYTDSGKITGTVLEDLYIDPIIKKVYQNEGLTIGFSAPVKDTKGNLLGVWKNFTRFDVIEGIVKDAWIALKDNGFNKYEITLFNDDGKLVLDYDPFTNKSETPIRDMSSILTTSLVDGPMATESAIKAMVHHEKGVIEDIQKSKNTTVVTGFLEFNGELGFKGMPWHILVRGSLDELHAPILSANRNSLIIFLISIVAILSAALLAVKYIATPVENIIIQLKDTTIDLRASSEQTASSAQALAQGASEQSASLEESAAAIEELGSSSRNNSQNASVAEDLAIKVKSASDTGAVSMQTMVKAMDLIKASADETATILKTIDEIAFQTNLLALNAAVEAARAGDAGKGFAVVADEVRSLAMRSAQAAKETAEKVKTSKDLAERGVKTTHEVSSMFADIQSLADKSAATVREISSAVKEQSVGITQLGSAVNELDKVTQVNSASAEESSAASEELKNQAGGLENIVGELSRLVYGAENSNITSYQYSTEDQENNPKWGSCSI